MMLEILAVHGIPEVLPGDDLATLIATHAPGLRDGDVIVVTSKIVSKAEGQQLDVEREAAIDAQTVRVVARRGDTRIVQTRHGFVMAAAGVDASNVTKGSVVVLPVDSDASARRIRTGLRDRIGVNVGVVVSDTFGRPWRVGVTDVAIGVAGITPLDDLRGTVDPYGNELQVTLTCTVDEIAAAADLVKGKLNGVPVAIVRGLAVVQAATESLADKGISQVVRNADDDMFSLGTRDVLRARVDATRFTGDAVDVERVRRAVETAAIAAHPQDWQRLRFEIVESPEARALIAAAVDDQIVTTAGVLVVPYLLDEPTQTDLLATGAGIENVLVSLAVEQLAARWVWPAESDASTSYPLGVIAVGQPAT